MSDTAPTNGGRVGEDELPVPGTETESDWEQACSVLAENEGVLVAEIDRLRTRLLVVEGELERRDFDIQGAIALHMDTVMNLRAQLNEARAQGFTPGANAHV